MLTEGALDSLVWFAPGWRNLPKREWEGEVFFYNRQTGDTHVANLMAQKLLDKLAGTGATTEELKGSFRTADWPLIEMQLRQLSDIGIIETSLLRDQADFV